MRDEQEQRLLQRWGNWVPRRQVTNGHLFFIARDILDCMSEPDASGVKSVLLEAPASSAFSHIVLHDQCQLPSGCERIWVSTHQMPEESLDTKDEVELDVTGELIFSKELSKRGGTRFFISAPPEPVYNSLIEAEIFGDFAIDLTLTRRQRRRMFTKIKLALINTVLKRNPIAQGYQKPE